MSKPKLKNAMSQLDVPQTTNIKPIHSGVNAKTSSDSKWDHACSVAWLMSPAGQTEAIKLQLENLVFAYGFQAVREGLNNVSLKNKRTLKKQVR